MEQNKDLYKVVQRTPSITPSGWFGDSKDMIVELEGFMTQEEIEFLEKAAKSLTIWDVTESHTNENGTVTYDSDYWKDRVATQPTLDKNDPKISPVIAGLFQRLRPIIEEFYKVEVVPTGTTIVKWLPGQFQNPHADKELHEGPDAGTPNDFPNYDLSSLFYLNDDYEGGELYFPLQGVQFKPKKGAAYFFPGDKNYIHGVTEIKSGLRFTCPFFWEITKHTGDNGAISWMPISFYESYSSVLPQDNDQEVIDVGLSPTIFSDIEKAMPEAIASVHDLDPKIISKIGYHTQKWEPGAYARVHSDNTDAEGKSGAFTRSRYAGFLYLNDDFEGGLLKFPGQNIEIKPEVGMLAVFDGGFNNMHEVSLITGGVRYTIGSFWDDREESDYPQELRDAWAAEMKATRAQQEIERAEWQELLKQGWKLDAAGNKYKADEL